MSEPCTRCGDCCKAEVCHMGENVYGTTRPPCPGLEKRGNRHACVLIEMTPEHLFPFLSMTMGIGWGCTNGHRLKSIMKGGEIHA